LNNRKHGSWKVNVWYNRIGSPINIWYKNYWGRPRLFPKIIIGWIYYGRYGDGLPILWPNIKFDVRPAKEPYDIEV